ncbi:MAG: transglycosylase domain-containing protein [Gammaproteobacteria bacterium]|nr:transglycosylase domain-containing protein [Gammaproteobacteria bacterium]
MTTRSRLSVWFKRTLLAAVALSITGAIAAGVVVYQLLPTLPSIESIRDIPLKVPLRVYTVDGKLIGEYGDYRRTPTAIADVPPMMVRAVLAAEDDSFYKHHGVDIPGIVRALIANLRSGDAGQGASTITMQVARNYFLTREKTYTRKIKEMLLSIRMEQALSKDEILELYVNKIFLGHRSYGFQGRGAVLLRQAACRPNPRRDRHARRPAQGAVDQQPAHQSVGRRQSPQLRPAPHARSRLHRRGVVPGGLRGPL